ncbi:hypothetical protein [Taibaiella soli]|uniref:Uncharacterized protein n=1 Tax=Taibaiella soli TaxID=1649169 RepID=A0A2W2BY05_9BACT|nr:hypothetical protein [Taibaiella soli]PZF72733.1 hypothetical protein DN068_12805 [Taibaiella soli]
MKKIIIVGILCFAELISCTGQQIKGGKKNKLLNQQSVMFEVFDIETFDKHKKNEVYEFYEGRNHVLQFGNYETGYVEQITYPDSLFFLYKEFYPGGSLKKTGLSFLRGNFYKGIWKFNDAAGRTTKEINYDLWFKFGWEEIRAFLKENNIDVEDQHTSISRTWEAGMRAVWWISYKIKRNDEFALRTITIDGYNGTVIKEDLEEFEK